MEQEIARFREAASMVGDIVAAEEGRVQQREMVQRAAPKGARASYPEFVVDDEVPPAYAMEAETPDSVIADGFRYTPGSETTASENAAVGGANDRLGYTK